MADSGIDFAGLETATTDISTQTAETSTQTDPGSQEDQGSNQGQQQKQTTEQQNSDGRRGPANIRNSIKAVAEWATNNAEQALPEHAAAIKELGNAYFREQAYKQVYPTVQEAQSAKQLIDGVGGMQGISQMQESLQNYEQMDSFLEAGDPQALDAIFENFADGAVQLAPEFLSRLAKANPEAFSEAIAPHIFSTLESVNFGNVLSALANETDPARAKALAQEFHNWYQSQKNGVATAKPATSQAKNPQADRLSQRETKLNERETQMFTEGVRSHVNNAVYPKLNEAIGRIKQSYGLNDAQAEDFQNSLTSRIMEIMRGDKVYGDQLKTKQNFRGKTHESVGSYIASEYLKHLAVEADKLAQTRWGQPTGKRGNGGGGPQKPGQPMTSPGGGPIEIAARPSNDDIDWSRPDAELNVINGQAYLKTGKFVSWAKARSVRS